MSQVQPIILAAGQGKRMSNPVLPKVLTPLKDKPLIGHLLSTIGQLNTLRPIVVVGYRHEQVESALGNTFTYVLQPELLGTAHAVQCCREAVQVTGAETVLVMNGDHPLYTAETITSLLQTHQQNRSVFSLATITTDEPAFINFGRIIRTASGDIQAIREYKDASAEELLITEYNPALYCFDSAWLWQAIERVHSDNAQQEYYITDLLAIAINAGERVASVSLERWQEALGVNTPEQLAEVEKWME